MSFRSHHDPATMRMHVQVTCDHCPREARQIIRLTFDRPDWRATSQVGFRDVVHRAVVREGWEWAAYPIREGVPVVCPLCLGARAPFSEDALAGMRATVVQNPHAVVRDLARPTQLAAMAVMGGRQVPHARVLVEILDIAQTALRLRHEADLTPDLQSHLEVLRIYVGSRREVSAEVVADDLRRPARVLIDGQDTGMTVELPPHPRVLVDERVGIGAANLPGVQRLGIIADERVRVPEPKPKPPRTIWERLLDDDDFDGV